MDVTELANYLGIPASTVYDWRVHGKGPAANRAPVTGRMVDRRLGQSGRSVQQPDAISEIHWSPLTVSRGPACLAHLFVKAWAL